MPGYFLKIALGTRLVFFGFEGPIFVRAWSGAQVKLRVRKVGHLERNLSTPVIDDFLHDSVSSFIIATGADIFLWSPENTGKQVDIDQ